MRLDGLMLDNFFFYPFGFIFARAKASIRPHILDLVVMYEVVKDGVFYFMGRIRTKNWMVL